MCFKPTPKILKYLVISLLIVSSLAACVESEALDTALISEERQEDEVKAPDTALILAKSKEYLDSLAQPTNSHSPNYFNIDKSCSEEQYHQLVSAVKMVFIMSNLATHEGCNEEGYKKWFDPQCNPHNHRLVKNVFSQINDNLKQGNVGFFCEQNIGYCAENKLVITYTLKNRPLFWVCNANFFRYPIVVDHNPEENTMTSLLTHAFSYNFGNTKDIVSGALDSSKLEPKLRIQNADNYAFYINYLTHRELNAPRKSL